MAVKTPRIGPRKGSQVPCPLRQRKVRSRVQDILTLGGMAAHNVRRHWIGKINELKLKGKEVSIPVEYQDQPPFWDHSYLGYLNERAKDHT
jgi:hypothetical protein